MPKENENIVELNRKIKDNVFLELFSDKENLVSFCNQYLDLKKPARADQITILAKGESFVKSLKTDMIFETQNQCVCVVEAMSSFSKGDIVRFSGYGFKAFYDYCVDHPKVMYGNDDEIKLPQFHIFVLYSGSLKVNETYSLKGFIYDGKSDLNAIIHFITPDELEIGEVTNQFLLFSKYESEFVEGRGKELRFSEEEVNNFIDGLIKKGILVKFLEERRHTLLNMFEELAGTEKYMKYVHDEGFNEGHQTGFNEGHQTGFNEGQRSGIKETQRNIVKNFAEMGMSPEEIAKGSKLPLDRVKEYLQTDK